MAARPIMTVTVFVTDDRQLAAKAERHGLDRIELFAAGGYLAAQAMTLAAQLDLAGRPVPPTLDNSHPPTEPPPPRHFPRG